jgi:hypothetical protein
MRFDKTFLRAATFAGAMLLVEHCFSGAGHHHHHHDDEVEYIADLVGRIAMLSATALTAYLRFKVADMTDNNRIAMGVIETVRSGAVEALKGEINLPLMAMHGLFGATLAYGINRVLPDDKVEPQKRGRDPR